MNLVQLDRTTNETSVKLTLGFKSRSKGDPPRDGTDPAYSIRINTGIGFFDHMLHALFFHGGMFGQVEATGDLKVDLHHTVEDVGLVLGRGLRQYGEQFGPLARFGRGVIPMDDALAEATVDVCGRPYLVYRGDFPQQRIGAFDVDLAREFFQGLTNEARINLHLHVRYGLNSHHMVEALFKAAAKAFAQAYSPADEVFSTKGTLEG